MNRRDRAGKPFFLKGFKKPAKTKKEMCARSTIAAVSDSLGLCENKQKKTDNKSNRSC